METLLVTLELPRELVERARAVGLEIERESVPIIAALETQIRKLEAGQRFQSLAARMDALPDDEKPTLEDIDAAQVQRLEAGRDMRQIMDQIQSLPDHLKPSLEQIDAEIRAV
jgi:DNA-binding ferritin-like protein (Dps family)